MRAISGFIQFPIVFSPFSGLIMHNNGYVIAEQLAPYLDTCLLESHSPKNDAYWTHEGKNK